MAKMLDIFRGLVVVRGQQPMPPREFIVPSSMAMADTVRPPPIDTLPPCRKAPGGLRNVM